MRRHRCRWSAGRTSSRLDERRCCGAVQHRRCQMAVVSHITTSRQSQGAERGPGSDAERGTHRMSVTRPTSLVHTTAHLPRRQHLINTTQHCCLPTHPGRTHHFEDLVVTLSVEHIECQSQDPQVSYTLQLIYLGVNASSTPHNTAVFQHTLVALTTSTSPIVVPCSLIDRAGLYQAVLTSSRQPRLPVAVSNVVVVDWSPSYSLSSSSLSKSCRQPVVVRHSQPRCHDVFYAVRVLVRQLPSNNDDHNRVEFQDGVTSRDWRYVTERRVKSSRTSVSFSCSMFQRAAADTINVEHCVLLLSRASDDSVHVHQRFCVTPDTQPHTGQISSRYTLILTTPVCCSQRPFAPVTLTNRQHILTFGDLINMLICIMII